MLTGMALPASFGLRTPQITMRTAPIRQICQMARDLRTLAWSIRATAVPKKITMPAISEKAGRAFFSAVLCTSLSAVLTEG